MPIPEHTHRCPTCGRFVDPDDGFYAMVADSNGDPNIDPMVVSAECKLYCSQRHRNKHEALWAKKGYENATEKASDTSTCRDAPSTERGRRLDQRQSCQ